MNYYDVFGIKPSASSEDISSAHKALAKMYHPDISDSEDAHERMALLNEANEVLSDSAKRVEYDKQLGVNQPLRQNPEMYSSYHSQILNAKWPREMKIPDERVEKAAAQRRKAEERLKADEAARARRMEQAKQKAEEEAKKSKQRRVDYHRQHMINELSSLVMGSSARQSAKKETDAEMHHATKVLLSLVKNDNEHLRRMTDETERKQRIEEILSLVKEYNEEANPDRFV